MRVALINEFSQASKNALIYDVLKKVATKYNVAVSNVGMKAENDLPHINYIQMGIQAFVLLNTKSVDMVITGCGSGQGACMSLNAFPGVTCGYIKDSTDAYLFTQINNGNAIALAFAKGFGWASEINLEDIFEKLFASERGCGYPIKMKEIQQKNSRLFSEIKYQIAKDPIEIIQSIDKSILIPALTGEEICNCIYENADASIFSSYIKEILKKQDEN